MGGGTHCWHHQTSLPCEEVKGRSSVMMPFWCASGGLRSRLSPPPSCPSLLMANPVPPVLSSTGESPQGDSPKSCLPNSIYSYRSTMHFLEVRLWPHQMLE